jgi:hypothetical protein
MSNTPETDGLARGNHVVPTEFAQDLERQLRKARDYVFRLRKQRAIARNFGNQMERERNGAREDAKRATYDAAQETIKVSTVKSHWIEACRERDHWKSESLEQAKLLAMGADREEKIVRERDEAREAFAIATSKCVDAQQRLREMEDQRDFAMSEMERLKR